MTDQVVGRETAISEPAGHEISRREIASHENAGHKIGALYCVPKG